MSITSTKLSILLNQFLNVDPKSVYLIYNINNFISKVKIL